jgi:hypothetical protein
MRWSGTWHMGPRIGSVSSGSEGARPPPAGGAATTTALVFAPSPDRPGLAVLALALTVGAVAVAAAAVPGEPAAGSAPATILRSE